MAVSLHHEGRVSCFPQGEVLLAGHPRATLPVSLHFGLKNNLQKLGCGGSASLTFLPASSLGLITFPHQSSWVWACALPGGPLHTQNAPGLDPEPRKARYCFLKEFGNSKSGTHWGEAVDLIAWGFLEEETAGLGDLGHRLGTTLLHVQGCGPMGPAWLCSKNLAKACCQVSVPWRLPVSVTFSPRPFLKLLGLDLRQLAWRWETQPGPLPSFLQCLSFCHSVRPLPTGADLICGRVPCVAVPTHLFSCDSSLGK